MRQLLTILACAAYVTAGVVSVAFADEAATTTKVEWPACPLMGDPIDPTLKLATDEGPVYFCCPRCVGKFQKEPAKFADKAKKLREEIAKLPQVQVTCPVSGEPVAAAVSTKHGDQTVSFCCPKCQAKFEAEPDKYAAQLANCSTLQTTCPLSHDPIDPKVFVEFGAGQRLYFCCTKCSGKFTADPAAFKDKLMAMNIFVDPKSVKSGT